jgi:hypothetical protein
MLGRKRVELDRRVARLVGELCTRRRRREEDERKNEEEEARRRKTPELALLSRVEHGRARAWHGLPDVVQAVPATV